MPQLPIAPLQASSPPARPRLDFLDGLRALAAMYVLLFHASSYQWSHSSDRAFRTVKPFLYGHEAVDLFIVLSGFSLMLPIVQGSGMLRGGAMAFFGRRAWRILPPYYAALAVCLVLDWTLISHKTGGAWDSAVPVSLAGVLAHLFLVQDVFASTVSQINSPMWSISVEWRIYFCFPLLVLAWRRLGPWVTTGLAFAVALVFQGALTHIPLFRQFNVGDSGISPQYLGLFALGMVGAGIAYSQNPRLALLLQRRAWAAVAAACAAAFVGIHLLAHGLFKTDVIVGVCSVGVIVIAAVHDGQLRRVLSWRPLVRIGTFAYSLYLLHFACLQLVWQYAVHPLHLPWPAEFAVHVLVGLPAAIGLSFLFFLAFERPFLTRRRSETAAEAARDAALSPAP